MASISLLLKDKNATDTTPIYLYCRAILLKYPTGVSIKPKHWDTKTQLIKGVVPNKEANNATLKRCKEAGIQAIAEILASGATLTKELLREKIDLLLGRTVLPDNSLLGFSIAHAFKARTAINHFKGKPLATKTVQNYLSAIAALSEFESLRSKPTQFEALNTDWILAFKEFLAVSKGYKINTIATYIKTLKVFHKGSDALRTSRKQDY